MFYGHINKFDILIDYVKNYISKQTQGYFKHF